MAHSRLPGLPGSKAMGSATVAGAMGPEEALSRVNSLIAQKPRSPQLRVMQGTIFVQLRRLSEAVASFRAALAINPNLAEVHFNLAHVFVDLGEDDAAAQHFANAVELRPDFVEAQFGLAVRLEKLNRVAELDAVVRSSVTRIGLENPQIAFIAGLSDYRNKNLLDAEAILTRIDPKSLKSEPRGNLYALLGKIYDRIGNYSEAFHMFQLANETQAATQRARERSAAKALDHIEKLIPSYKSAPPTRWPDYRHKGSDTQLAFLLGFPRSGTTLLDTILRSHPRVEVIEEKPTVYAMRARIADDQTFERLNSLLPEDLRGLANAYFDELRKHTDADLRNHVIVDKLPLNMASVALIKRVFPQAKLILALRHPCDCVLSVFMQQFQLNDAMMNFLSLRDAAIFYDRVMQLWKVYEQVLNLDYHVVRYEEIVSDFESTISELLIFLGLEWDDSVAKYRETAIRGRRIRTPSYQQVTEEIYTRATGRWINYRKEMEPVLPLLNPWATSWGY
jgi:tetratricopeptide (TPR) repeat protein